MRKQSDGKRRHTINTKCKKLKCVVYARLLKDKLWERKTEHERQIRHDVSLSPLVSSVTFHSETGQLEYEYSSPRGSHVSLSASINSTGARTTETPHSSKTKISINTKVTNETKLTESNVV